MMTIEPNGCHHCGVSCREHVQRWSEGVGWHAYVQPTDAQRLARMLIRAKERADDLQPGIAALKRRIAQLEACITEFEADARKLAAPENTGVDNWEGYDVAMDLLREYKREDGVE